MKGHLIVYAMQPRILKSAIIHYVAEGKPTVIGWEASERRKKGGTTTNKDKGLYQLNSSMICFLEKLPEAVFKRPTIASVNSQTSYQVLKNST